MMLPIAYKSLMAPIRATASRVSLQMTGRALISLKVNDANAMSASCRPPELVRKGHQDAFLAAVFAWRWRKSTSAQYVGEACSAFVDVVVTTAAAEQFGLRCLPP
jgi:hypothetical protein